MDIDKKLGKTGLPPGNDKINIDMQTTHLQHNHIPTISQLTKFGLKYYHTVMLPTTLPPKNHRMIEKTSECKQFCKRFEVLYCNSRAVEDASRRISLKYLSCLYCNLRLYFPTTNSKQTLSTSSVHICFSINNWKSLLPHVTMSDRKKIIHI